MYNSNPFNIYFLRLNLTVNWFPGNVLQGPHQAAQLRVDGGLQAEEPHHLPAGEQEQVQQDLWRLHHAPGLRAGLGQHQRVWPVSALLPPHGRHLVPEAGGGGLHALLQLTDLLYPGPLCTDQSLCRGNFIGQKKKN